MDPLITIMNEVIAIAHSLFNRGKTAGSSANISFRYNDSIYISGTNTSFGTLTKHDFSELSIDGHHVAGPKPSKEYPLHLIYYRQQKNTQCVIHTHSFYSTLWSCLKHNDSKDVVPAYTPYLSMKLGAIPLIAYNAPGSTALFLDFEEKFSEQRGYLLANHGPIIGGASAKDAFYCLEELEESCRIAWELRDTDQAILIS